MTIPLPPLPSGRAPVSVRLHGPMAAKYGADHTFHVGSPREAVAALCANHRGFQKDFLDVGHWAILADGDWRESEIEIVAPVSRSIDLCPVIEGEVFVGAALVGALIPALAGTAAATIIGGILVTGLLLGVSLLLTPKQPKATGKKKDQDKNDSYQFSGPENITEQGVPVPLLFGVCHTGSVVVSAGLHLDSEFTTVPAAVAASQNIGLVPGSPITFDYPFQGPLAFQVVPIQDGVPWRGIGAETISYNGNTGSANRYVNPPNTWMWDNIRGFTPIPPVSQPTATPPASGLTVPGSPVTFAYPYVGALAYQAVPYQDGIAWQSLGRRTFPWGSSTQTRNSFRNPLGNWQWDNLRGFTPLVP